MKKISLISLLAVVALFFFSPQMQAQHNDGNGNIERCGTSENLARQLKANPKLKQIRKNIEVHTQEYISNIKREKDVDTIRLPIVVHVIHDGDPIGTNENLADIYILAQIDQMNDDFRRKNSNLDNTWPQAADTYIEFCLATMDPMGNPTTGIIRHNITGTDWTMAGFDANVKPITIWDRDSYMNLWTAALEPDLLGYAQFPGLAANTDGVVNLWSSVGSIATPNPAGGAFGLGRTVTHEVGHFLNLFHIWGDDAPLCTGSDECADTPNQASDTGGCPTGVQTDACSPAAPGYMYQNYMDYSNDICMNLFTVNQRERMQALFAPGGAREDLGNAPCGGGNNAAPMASFTPNSGTLDLCMPSGAVTFSNTSTGTPTPTWSWTFSGAGVSPTTSSAMAPNVTVTTSGTLVATLTATNSEGMNTQSSNIVINMLANTDPACSAPLCDAANTAIPDGDANGLARVINIPAGSTITDINVEVDITHTYVGDIKVTLEHLGTTVVLIDQPGVPTDQFGCGSANIVDCILDDESTNPTVEDICNPTAPAITGTYKPMELLSAFDGMDSAGDWTLTVSDNEGGDDGVLDEWCLTIDTGAGSDCLTMAQLIGTVTGNKDYESADFIETTQMLVNGSQVDYDAVTSILFENGFEMEAGAIMAAFIDGCNEGGGGVNLKGDLDVDKN